MPVISIPHKLLADPLWQAISNLPFVEKTYLSEALLTPAIAHLRDVIRTKRVECSVLDERLHEIAQHLLQVHFNVYREIEVFPSLRFATRNELYRRLHLARDYADALFNTPPTLADMAQVACLSPNHLLRTFKQLFHQTPHQYIISKRLQVAERLLAHTDAPVTDICLQVGFESLTTFSGTFRRRYGLSPHQFRAQKK